MKICKAFAQVGDSWAKAGRTLGESWTSARADEFALFDTRVLGGLIISGFKVRNGSSPPASLGMAGDGWGWLWMVGGGRGSWGWLICNQNYLCEVH